MKKMKTTLKGIDKITQKGNEIKNTELHQDARALSGLVTLASSLNASHSEEILLQNFTRGLKDIWPGAGIILFEIDRDAGFLIPMDSVTSDPVPILGSLIGSLLNERECKIVRHLDDHSGYIRGREAPPGLKWSGMVACPFPATGKPTHVVAVYRTESEPVVDYDKILLKRALTLLEPLLTRWRVQERQLEAFLQIARAMATAADSRDPYMIGHSERVSEFAQATARTHGLFTGFIERLSLAGLLHDLGRLGVPESILLKPDALTPEEMRIVRAHPDLSVRFLENVDYLQETFSAIRHHHERYDGDGYPDRIDGDDIPLGARILAVADSFDAMTSPRPFRGPMSDKEALHQLKMNKGTQFDPIIVEAFLRAHEEKLILSQNVLRAEDPLANLRTLK